MDFLKRWLVVLFGVAFLNANALGAHLHYCFDGKEPRSSLHLLDGQEDLHHLGTHEKHNDKDVKLTDQALAKFFKFSASPPAVPVSWAAPVVVRVETAVQPFESDEQAVPSAWLLPVPPQRGPPV